MMNKKISFLLILSVLLLFYFISFNYSEDDTIIESPKPTIEPSDKIISKIVEVNKENIAIQKAKLDSNKKLLKEDEVSEGNKKLKPKIITREEMYGATRKVIKMIPKAPLEKIIPNLFRESDGKIPYPYLRMAAMKGRTDLLQYIFKHAPVNSQEKLNDLLKYSANSGNIETVKYLLSFGAYEKPYIERKMLDHSSLIERSIKLVRKVKFTEQLLGLGFTIDRQEIDAMKRKKWLKPESLQIIDTLESKGLL